MVLRPLLDVSPADWFAGSPVDGTQACLGPGGFAAYARVLHPVLTLEEPGDEERAEGHLDEASLAAIVDVLARHTSSPQQCYFGLWDGFGDVEGGSAMSFLTAGNPSWFGRIYRAPRSSGPPPAFARPFLDGPRVRFDRDYLLFAGPLEQAGAWGAADVVPGQPRPINSPNLMWPEDHAWFVMTNIESPWTGVGGSEDMIAALVSDRRLEAVRASYAGDRPEHR